ncbi:FMN reductase [Streptomyces alkaliterrae]|uniref:FMN reductase n=1 Tax=Streptomyces alkaliterrae TaxID=2213162 RepID=A0A5P0YVZ1_9ACTN|nr:FMN reductase [Streptomyces alkaliterrae]MBB1261994.1 FMN reductase [Streptomyces alkaliterrae]MQS04464.1 oxidoreductase [Streptomyces alkaliterrae]
MGSPRPHPPREAERRATLAVVTAGLGEPSTSRLLADRLAYAARDQLAARGRPADVHVVELRELAGAIADHMVTGFPPARLRDALAEVATVDALIAVTPVFAASYSGLFKSFFDLLEPDALRGTPVLMAATGGTARHSLALEHAVRPLFGYLRAPTVPTAVFAAPEDWGGGDRHTGELAARVERAAGELADMAAGTRGRAAAAPPATGTEAPLDVVPFAEQLAALSVRN